MRKERPMPEKKNALAKLAEQITDVLAFAQDELYLEHKQTLDKCERIVAELAKVESLYERMNTNANNGNIVKAEELAHELYLAEGSMFAKCRAIAEEGGGDGKL